MYTVAYILICILGILIGGREHSSPGIHSEDTKGEENTNMSEEDKRLVSNVVQYTCVEL